MKTNIYKIFIVFAATSCLNYTLAQDPIVSSIVSPDTIPDQIQNIRKELKDVKKIKISDT